MLASWWSEKTLWCLPLKLQVWQRYFNKAFTDQHTNMSERSTHRALWRWSYRSQHEKLEGVKVETGHRHSPGPTTDQLPWKGERITAALRAHWWARGAEQLSSLRSQQQLQPNWGGDMAQHFGSSRWAPLLARRQSPSLVGLPPSTVHPYHTHCGGPW